MVEYYFTGKAKFTSSAKKTVFLWGIWSALAHSPYTICSGYNYIITDVCRKGLRSAMIRIFLMKRHAHPSHELTSSVTCNTVCMLALISLY